MQDIQLAFLLVRLYLNDRGLFEDKKAAIYGVRTEDFKSDDYIKRLLWDHAIEQSRIEGDRWMLSLIFCWLQSPWESFVSLFDWPEQLSNELSAPSAPQEPELFIAYEILMDKIDKRKVSPPQKLTGPTADSFRIWQQQLIEKQIRFFFGIIAGAESKGFHVTLLSLLDKMAVLVTSQRFTRIYQSASVARRLPALTSAGKSINSGIIHWEDFSEQLEKPNALIMGTARSLFDDEGDDDLLGSQRKMKPISLFDDYDATDTSKTVLLFDDGPEHKIMLNNDGSRCGSSSSGYPDQPFLEASANKILSYKHHIGESLIPVRPISYVKC
jgi:hypothetical protein